MRRLTYQLLTNLLKRKNLQVSLILVFVTIGVFSTLSYQNFFYLQAQNIDRLSVFNEIIKPLSGLVLLVQIFIICISASQLVPYYFERGQQSLLLNSSLSNLKLVLNHVFVVVIFGLIPWCYFLLISFSYYLFSDLDVWLLLVTGFALLMGGVLFSLLMFATTLFFKKTLTALIVTMVVAMLVLGIDEFLRHGKFSQSISIYSNFFLHLRDGLVFPVEITRLLLWIMVSFSILILAMQRLRLSKQRWGIVLLLISVSSIGINGLFENKMYGSDPFNLWLSETTTPKKQWDISREKLNSFGKDIADQIAKVNRPIIVTAVVDDEANHDEIRQAFAVIKQYNSNVSLDFTSRQALAIDSRTSDQFVIIKIGKQQQTIRYPFDRPAKESLAQMIIQLASRVGQWVTFIEGHDEASPFGKTNQDINSFFASLKNLGWSVAVQNLTKQNFISENTKVLVIAASKKEWLPQEINTVSAYLKKGGNLLLLLEQNDSFPKELQNHLAIKSTKGILVDWQGYQSGTPHPAILIVNQFEPHSINTNINSLLAFPWSVGLELDDEKKNSDNKYRVILKTHQGVWNEFNSEEVELAFNSEVGEQRRVFDLAYSIENKKLQQRMVVVGDSSFLSDSAINNYANRQFSLNLISWLTAQNIELLATPFRDNYIRTTPVIHFLFKWLFSLILPVFLLVAILLLQLKKRKAGITKGKL